MLGCHRLACPKPRPEGYRCSRPANYDEMWEAMQKFVPYPDEVNPIPGTWPAFEHSWSNVVCMWIISLCKATVVTKADHAVRMI